MICSRCLQEIGVVIRFEDGRPKYYGHTKAPEDIIAIRHGCYGQAQPFVIDDTEAE